MIVAGGAYREECVYPRMDALLGSGGRALTALRTKIDAELHTFFPDPETIRLNFGERTVVHQSSSPFSFQYLHPLAAPRLTGHPTQTLLFGQVTHEQVLRFGCVEGHFKVDAQTAVYDPQGSGQLFSGNGSRAERLAIVLNEGEAAIQTGCAQPEDAASMLLVKEGAEAVVIKRGVAGCLAVDSEGRISHVPAFRTRRVFKIGSGDIFSAAFAYAWMVCEMAVEEAAHFASSNAASYVESRNPVLKSDFPPLDPVRAQPSQLTIAVVSDQKTMLDHWLAWEAKTSLDSLGVRHVQLIDQFERQSLSRLLRGMDAVVALPRTPDGMAMEAIAAGRAAGIPTHAFCDVGQGALRDTLSDEAVYDDFVGCLYNSTWT